MTSIERFKVGIDIGGTHTDLVVVSGSDQINTYKVPTTPDHLPRGVLKGIEKAAHQQQLSVTEFLTRTESIVHGTTVTTNALLEDTQAKTGLITTDGFRDVVELHMERAEDMYNLHSNDETEIVPRYLRHTIPERIDKSGDVVTTIDEDEVQSSIKNLQNEGVESIAVVLMNSYINSEHEEYIEELINSSDEESLSEITWSFSSNITPQIGLYHRILATVINASLRPVLRNYLNNLRDSLRNHGFVGSFLIMKSNGGSSTAETLQQKAVMSVNSGPAAATIGNTSQAAFSGFKDIISVDIGGTSSDVCLIQDGTPIVTNNNSVGEVPVPVSMVDINTIGAGGGSIVSVDNRGVIQVGPESAGADPGPICYDQGGTQPTVTDVNLELGYLNPDFFLGGEKTLNQSKSHRGIKDNLSEPLDLTIDEVAAGINKLANDQITNQIRQVSIQKGYDPRDFALVTVGGAGPLYAASLSRQFDTTAIVPETAGTISAFGLLQSEIKHDFVRSISPTPLSEATIQRIDDLYQEMKREARETLRAEGVTNGEWKIEQTINTRYEGQFHDVDINLPKGNIDTETIVKRHHKKHEDLYTFRDTHSNVEVVDVRLTAVAQTNKPGQPGSQTGVSADDAIKGYREVYDEATEEFRRTPIYDGEATIRDTFSGPAVVELAHTTIVVPSDIDGRVDEFGNYILSPK